VRPGATAAVATLAAALLALAAPVTVLAAAKPAPDLGSEAQRAAGKKLYTKWCSQCHGDAGDGQGIAAPHLLPAPRDFTSGKFKLRSTPSGGLPTDADLERSIRTGLAYTAMPAFTEFSDDQLHELVYYIKSFSPVFADPERYLDPLDLPKPPPYSAKAAEEGKQVYQELGCAACHGETGHGNGPSAPAQKDDWGHEIRPADLSKPWAFRGGPTRADVFRAISTGLNGTPMAGFNGAIPPEKMWKLVDFIVSLSGNRTEAPYTNVVDAVGVDDELDLERGAELFAAAPPALIPMVGQITEPGRDFYPATNAVEVRAVFNQKEIAFLVSWHDMRAETSGHNAPDLVAPLFDEELAKKGAGAAKEEEGGGFWGEEAPAPAAPAAPSGDDSGGFWGEASATPAVTPETEFSDAVGIQFPQTLPTGVVKPYFIFGDAQDPVELWYTDLANGEGKLYQGRGSGDLTPADGDPPAVKAAYTPDGWSVAFKRPRLPRSGIGFAEDTFVPVAFTVWDGFNRERGNKRALSAWQYVYVRPRQRPSPAGPIAKAIFVVLVVELLVIGWVRRRKSNNEQGRPAGASASQGTTL
jgi:mono/diheme cytochrome c family protein